ncbi:MAG: Hsp20/alpha crystallin family protein [Ilumatobacter sp.]|nr:Hsp20/alpha crystallin family protein [Ilumatobacter sp.]
MIVRHRPAPSSLDLGLDRAFDQLANSFFDSRRSTGPVVDGAWSGDEYVLTVDLPGVPASAVNVEVTGTTLTLAVETDELSWKRSLRLGGRLDPENVTAHHVDGRLTVRVGAYAEPAARTIEISTAAPAIEAASTDAESSDAAESTDSPNDDD